jgi:hypothetical protein
MQREGDSELLGLVADGLDSIFPGAVVVDRELAVAPPGRDADPADSNNAAQPVDLVAIDGDGRLLLVARTVADGDRAALFVLDALVFARKNLSLFARHYANGGLDPDAAPLVVLVAERFEPRLLERLGGLDSASVVCLEVRLLASRQRQEVYLVPVVPGGNAAPGRAEGGRPVDFLQHMDPELRPTGERLLERLQRIDEDLTATCSGRQMRFALDGEALCVLTAHAEWLEARVLPEGGTFRISTRADVDAFLEEVLQRALELFEHRGGGSLLAPPPASPTGPPTASPAGQGAEALREAALDPLMPAGAILTDEEIEAFRSMR